MIYPALSVQQPWPWAMFHAGKDIENRSWATKFRGKVLIHAGKKIDFDGIEWLADEGYNVPGEYELLTGGIIGVATIVDCVKESDSKWFFGEYGFVLKGCHEIPFMPCKGKLGFFNVVYDVIK